MHSVLRTDGLLTERVTCTRTGSEAAGGAPFHPRRERSRSLDARASSGSRRSAPWRAVRGQPDARSSTTACDLAGACMMQSQTLVSHASASFAQSLITAIIAGVLSLLSPRYAGGGAHLMTPWRRARASPVVVTTAVTAAPSKPIVSSPRPLLPRPLLLCCWLHGVPYMVYMQSHTTHRQNTPRTWLLGKTQKTGHTTKFSTTKFSSTKEDAA
jgi:hypothetical protein